MNYRSVRVTRALRPSTDGEEPWRWLIDPYVGCDVGCALCPARLEARERKQWLAFEQEIGVKTNLVEAFLGEWRSPEVEHRPLVLGGATEPWQPVEEALKLTRALLAAMAECDDVDLWIHTRSSLIARDTDALLKVQARGRVAVSFSMASVDERVNRLVEPKAPSAMRRLAAMQALARAGVPVGIQVGPALLGLEERELGLEGLLARAANAGARFAALAPAQVGPEQRDRLLAYVGATTPERVGRLRRALASPADGAEARQKLEDRFDALCAKLGLSRHVEPANATRRCATPLQFALPWASVQGA